MNPVGKKHVHYNSNNYLENKYMLDVKRRDALQKGVKYADG